MLAVDGATFGDDEQVYQIINQSLNQSINLSINQSFNQSIESHNEHSDNSEVKKQHLMRVHLRLAIKTKSCRLAVCKFNAIRKGLNNETIEYY